eukprot:1191060-Prorocentrum_minimum.AAC.1
MRLGRLLTVRASPLVRCFSTLSSPPGRTTPECPLCPSRAQAASASPAAGADAQSPSHGTGCCAPDEQRTLRG